MTILNQLMLGPDDVVFSTHYGRMSRFADSSPISCLKTHSPQTYLRHIALLRKPQTDDEATSQDEPIGTVVLEVLPYQDLIDLRPRSGPNRRSCVTMK